MKKLLIAVGLIFVISLDFTINLIGDHTAYEVSIELSKESSESETKEKSETQSFKYLKVSSTSIVKSLLPGDQIIPSEINSEFLYLSPWNEIPYPPPELS